jgi:protease-4
MIAFLRTFFAVIAAFLFLLFVPLIALVAVALLGHTGPREDTWLVVRLSGSLLEWYGPTTLRDLLEDPPPCLMEITENLEKAAGDPRIEGVILKLESFHAGTGKLDEIRAGLQRVRDSGKPIYAYAEALSDGTLYLASECDSTFLSPDGRIRLLGRGVTIEHVKGTLEKLAVQEQFHVIDEYKSAAEFFTDKESSPEAIENVRWLVAELDSAYDETLATNRGIARGDLAALKARGLLRAEDARTAGLVDELLHWDELQDRLRGPLPDLRTISSEDYADVDRGSLGLAGAAKVAVIHGQGFVASDGEDRYDPVWGVVMGVDRVVEDLDRARKDESVDAILLRWDTPGGATDGARRVGRAVTRARQEKPVVVSIADEAASGGYMISAPAHRIVCPSNGITGSIESITGKLNVRGLWEKLGVTFDDLAFAPNAFLDSELHDWTLEQREIVAEEHWAFYRSWVEEIAQTRSLPAERVDKTARDKVWTGRQAKERGLVDALGGFQDAVLALRDVAAIAESEKIEFEHWPKEETLLDILVSGDLGRVAATDWAFRIRTAFQDAGRTVADPLVLSRVRVR